MPRPHEKTRHYLVPELEDEAILCLTAGERGAALSPHGKTRQHLVPELEDKATPHLQTRERGTVSSPRGKTRRRLVLELEDEAAPRLRARLVFQRANEGLPREGTGLLRLHSTYRHDLKIYSSDEGRVQVPSYTECTGPLLDCWTCRPAVIVFLCWQKSQHISMAVDAGMMSHKFRMSMTLAILYHVRYDLLHNAHLNLEGLAELFKVAQVTYMFFCIKYLIT
ncbi:hypothetical protein BHE74_00001607 [Ensete ventricosum]|nr:hypothetical protein BHE74_00001607 [Ensete ventricosum]